MHPSRHVTFPAKFGRKNLQIMTSHDVLEPLKQLLLASRDVIISGQIGGSKLQRVFTFGDGCWLPIDVQVAVRKCYLLSVCPFGFSTFAVESFSPI